MSDPREPLISRRLVAQTAGSVLLLAACGRPAERVGVAPPEPLRVPPARGDSQLRFQLGRLEQEIGGRLGLAALNTATGVRVEMRAAERFPMCSTFKLALVAAVLTRADAGQDELTRSVSFSEADLLEYAPITRAHIADGSMTVAALCEAAITVSDNTAANLLLDTLGGPPGLTAYFRTLGDGTSRLDRREGLLNSALPGDPRDTTTPRAMLGNLDTLLVGSALSAPARSRLIAWLCATKTGDKRLRAGLPANFRAGDKTGTGDNGATNDLAIAWPEGKPPLLIAAYTVGSSESTERISTALARAARLVVSELGAG